MRPSNETYTLDNTAGAKYSDVIDGQYIFSGSIITLFSDGSASGTLTLEGSNDPVGSISSGGRAAPVNWVTVSNGSTDYSADVTSGATTTWSIQWLNFRWYRITWSRSGGAGTLTAYCNFQGAS